MNIPDEYAYLYDESNWHRPLPSKEPKKLDCEECDSDG